MEGKDWKVAGIDEARKEKSRERIEPDPHGIVEVFASRLNTNLKLMHPEMAAREAMAVVDGYLKGSKFIDLGSKSSSERTYIRVDKRPEEVKR